VPLLQVAKFVANVLEDRAQFGTHLRPALAATGEQLRGPVRVFLKLFEALEPVCVATLRPLEQRLVARLVNLFCVCAAIVVNGLRRDFDAMLVGEALHDLLVADALAEPLNDLALLVGG
jgi:hypothetical protein